VTTAGVEPTPNPVLEAIRSRRVVRAVTDEPLDRASVETVLDAARWASTAGNRHLQRFVVTDDAGTLQALRMVSPGMEQRPTTVIAICVDWGAVAAYGFPPHVTGPYLDVGTAMATMLLAAHAIGVGASPVSSFSRAAAGAVLRLPDGWRAEVMVGLGHPAPVQPPPFARTPRLTWRDLTTWVPPRA
jgi:nitroreductase